MNTSAISGRSLLDRERSALVIFVIVIVFVLAVLPLGRLFLAAFAPGGVFTPQTMIDQIASRAGQRALWATVETSVGSSAIALLLGAILALAVTTTDIRGRQRFTFLFVLSMLISPQVAAVAFLSLVGPASPLLKTFGLAPDAGTVNPLLGREGIILVMGLHHAPLTFVVLVAGLKRVPRSLIEAAKIDRASPPRIVRTILFPIMRPHLVSAALLAFVAGAGNFGIPAILGLPVNYVTIPTLIYRRLSSFGPSIISDVAALGILVAGIAGLGVMASQIVMRSPSLLEDEDRLEPFWSLGRLRPVAEILIWALLGLVLILPGIGLLAAAFVPSYGMPLSLTTITLDNFVEIALRQQVTIRAFGNSLLFAGVSAITLTFVAIPIAYVLVRRSRHLSGTLLAFIEAPYALPGIVLAIACILLFLKPLPVIGISLYATPWIIIVSYLARFLAVVVKPTLAAMVQLETTQEEAAALDGAKTWRRLCDIIAPSLFPAAAAGGLLAFLFAFGELTVSALLWSTGTETIGVVLFSFEEAGLASQAAAIGVVTIAVITATMLILDAMRGFLPEGVLPWRI